MIKKIKQKLLAHKSEIHFEPETHSYYHFKKDLELVSVSNTLDYFSKGLDMIPAEILQRAIDRGSMVHTVAEAYVDLISHTQEPIAFGDLLELAKLQEHYQDSYEIYIYNLYTYLQEQFNNGWLPLCTEQMFFSIPERIAGTADLILYKQIDQEITLKIVDYKTGNLKVGNFAQVGIYQYMLKKALKGLKMANITIESELISLKDMETMKNYVGGGENGK